ncbi:uncharacterized protein B0T23DRAFT_393791 [Neurospora hispaniola]|uniref:Uncharacterized protein n=1 Tax=Neurospora hispaniola TaxID=588809 RepID=A0AAJ0MUG0_9PEZI|nr:hypothetical protein B0T23DRAFT_393791 [Neurospora hispaniola]
MAEFHAICTTLEEISRRLNNISRISAKIAIHTQKCSAWYKQNPRLRKWWATACLAITVFVVLQTFNAWRLSKMPRQTFQQPKDTKATVTASTPPTSHTIYPTPVQQTQRINDGLSSDRRLWRENNHKIVTPAVTQLLSNMCGLHPHEVLWVCNTVSAWFGRVGWESVAWLWSFVGGLPIRRP